MRANKEGMAQLDGECAETRGGVGPGWVREGHSSMLPAAEAWGPGTLSIFLGLEEATHLCNSARAPGPSWGLVRAAWQV